MVEQGDWQVLPRPSRDMVTISHRADLVLDGLASSLVKAGRGDLQAGRPPSARS